MCNPRTYCHLVVDDALMGASLEGSEEPQSLEENIFDI